MGKTTITKDVEVDIDLDEFDNEDILDRAEEIIKKAELGVSGYDKKLSIEFRNAIHSPSFTPNVSKVDEWKDELWPLIKAKLSLEELEALIK